jgi:N-acetylmuramoyl-L-alanine amidase
MQINRDFSSPNYAKRTKEIEYIIVHFTEMTFKDALEKLLDKNTEVSAHYLIKENGEIFQLVNDEHIAWHAGNSSWYGVEALNQNSIGIEIDNLGDREFDEEQMKSCIELSQFLMKKYKIPVENFIGHSDIAPSRKIDPGIFFNWELCAKNELGIWHNSKEPESSSILFKFGDATERIKQLQKNLKKIGYNIDETGEFDKQTNFVVRAFQSKFYPKIIRRKGLEFYQNINSQYFWDSFSEQILQKLLSILGK